MTFDNLTKILQSPWGVIVAILLVLLLWEGAKKWVPALVEWLARAIRAKLAGTRFMHGRALRVYREQVASRYARLPVLLSPGKGIDASTVYVPLQAVGDRGAPAEAYDQIKATDHAIVLGRPGSGKTMLLRHSMLTWARDPSWRRDQRVPVLLELARCGGDRSLAELIVAQFAEDGFAKADRFVAPALRDGKLSVLFDGLDEVSAAERGNVVQSLRSFAARYAKCQIVVTCRTAIYEQQLAPEIITSFQVAEFDDHHIRRFLRQWPGIVDDTGVERLMSALRDAPRIMQLARNPLLLTMIAHLYGGRSSAETVLPHSRAEFYDEVVNTLLGRLKDSQNRFKGAVKRAVLVRLAAAIQDTAATSSDRRTRSYEDVLFEISSIKERLNITDVEGVLDEIVDRSGLLLRVDGGTRYQFAHLSLQEYLAAVAFEQDPDGLLARYRAAPGDWREVVKLWCGVVSTDCGSLIESVFHVDEVLAFECLADAQIVDPATADRIVEHFQRHYLEDRPDIVNAFGLVAGDPRPRGRRVFEYLVGRARAGVPGAHAALAATKLPEAGDVLVERIDTEHAAWAALIAMGDIALPALVRAATAEYFVVSALGFIGTPAAAVALTRFLTRADDVATHAAWFLAALIEDPEVEAALGETEVPGPPTTYAWIWEPFSSGTRAYTTRVAAWVAYRCGKGDPGNLPSMIQRVDPRLAIPLLVFEAKIDIAALIRPIKDISHVENIMALGGMSYSATPARGVEDSGAGAIIDARVEEKLEVDGNRLGLRLYRALDETLRISLVARWAGRYRYGEWRTRSVHRQDWAHVGGAATGYEYARSPQFWIAWVTCGLVAILATVGGAALLITDRSWGPTWLGWVLVVAAGLWFLVILVIGMTELIDKQLSGIFSTLFVGYLIYKIHDKFDGVVESVAGCLAILGSGATTALPLLVGVHYLGWPTSLGLYVLVMGVVGGFEWYGVRRERAERNLFVGLLDLDQTARRRTSVIAG